MALESATYINDLVATNPTSSDNVSDGDNHIRLIKAALKTTFPSVTGAVTKTHTQLNTTVVTVEAATNANTASTIVKRDASGNFTAGTVTANLTGNVTGNVTGTVSGNAGTATRWANARSITLTGDVSGSTSIDGSGNVSMTTTIADDSHNHTIANVDGLQIALDGKLPIGSNAVSASKWATARTITLGGDLSGSVLIDGSANVTLSASVVDDSHNHTIANVDGLQTALNGKLDSGANAVSASKWATPRTISLGGDLSGSALVDGSANVTITASVADDSHNHTIANVDGLQTALNGKLDSTANAVSASKWATARTIALGGDLSGSALVDGSANVTITAAIADDSHNHTIANVDGLQTALDSKLNASSYTANDVLTKIKTVDGPSSGLDADTIDGVQASDLVQDSDFTQSLSASGWTKLPNGLTIQWGRVYISGNTANVSVSFPTTFSNACFSVVVNSEDTALSRGDNYGLGTTAPTTTTFRITNGCNDPLYFRFIAIGH